MNNINLQTRLITVEGLHSKSRRRGLVNISPNLGEWLARGQAHMTKPRDYWTLRDMKRKTSHCSGIALSPDIFRHTFASYHLAKHKNAALTAHEMRNSERIVFQRYRELVTPSDAEAYFTLTPASVQRDPAHGSAAAPL